LDLDYASTKKAPLYTQAIGIPLALIVICLKLEHSQAKPLESTTPMLQLAIPTILVYLNYRKRPINGKKQSGKYKFNII
jgi:hypothetical protein